MILGQWNLDISRHARECLSPQDYARFGYYEKWIAGLTDLLVDRKMLAEYVAKILASGGPADRPSDIPALFTIGQRVKTRVHGNTLIDGGHTRLPSYARGKTGWIIAHHGTHVLNRFIPSDFMRVICGTLKKIQRMKWCWICGNPIWTQPDG